LAADFSIQAAATHLIAETPWDCAAVCFTGFTTVSARFGAFQKTDEPGGSHPYASVLRAYVCILDQMLARLVALAGEECDVLVTSPCGLEWTSAAGASQTTEGFLIGNGQQLAPDALLHGASVLDLAPTVLAFFGVPLPRSLQGRALLEAFRAPSPIEWQEADISSPDDQPSQAWPDTPQAIAWDWNLARACLDEGRLDAACTLLERLCSVFPENADFQQALFRVQLRVGAITAANETLPLLLETIPPGALPVILQAELALALEDQKSARELIKTLPAERHLEFAERIGYLLLHLREWTALEALARAALKRDASQPMAWIGLGEALLRQGDSLQAARAALEAIRCRYFLPTAHLLLVRALAAEKAWLAAIQALDALLRMQPGNEVAQRYRQRLRRIIPREQEDSSRDERSH
jgi:tetratricopeptide (TPR) repeat protein